MMQSLLIKLAMLAVTLGSLLWIASVSPVTKVMPQQAHQPSMVPVTTASSKQMGHVEAVPRLPAVQSDQPASPLVRPAAKPVEVIERSVGQETASADPRQADRGAVRQIDLNQATVADLEALPGIGPKLAQRVIAHRDARGPFHSVDDLRQVRGIGRKKFDRLRPHVLVTNTRSLARHKGTL
ncbi:MAG: hypothetical protein GDA66_00760 [Nitrospira sp. CR1.2]|nr:hypothetical protein [Nitrospira sp. CR1.2]